MWLSCFTTVLYNSFNKWASDNAPVLIIIRLLFDETIFSANILTASWEAASTTISACLNDCEDVRCENLEKIEGLLLTRLSLRFDEALVIVSNRKTSAASPTDDLS